MSAVILASVFASASAPAQSITTATWNGGTGNWGSTGSWSGGTVPSGSTVDAFVDNKTSTASLAQITLFYPQVTLRNLRIDSNDAVSLGSSTSLTVATLLNSGTLTISSTGSLNFSGTGDAISGGGKIFLNGGTITSASFFGNSNAISGSGSLTNLQGNFGTILANVSGKGMTIDLTSAGFNFGTFTASAGGYMNLISGKLSNSGTLLATAGSQVSVGSGVTLTNTATGKVIADGGSIYVFGSRALTRDDEFAAINGGSVFLDSLSTAARTLTGAAGGTLSVQTLNNNGGSLTSAGDVTIGNATNVGGRISLNGSTGSRAVINAIINNSGGTFSVSSNGAFTLDNYNTITGGTFESSGGGALNVSGQFNYSGGTVKDLTNNGTINLANNANVAGTIDGSGVLNFNIGYQNFSVGTVTLGGTGTANLARCNADSAYSNSGGSVTLINDVSHAISGYGNFMATSGGTPKTIINRGLIQSTPIGTSAGGLAIGGTFTNTSTGTLRALTGSSLAIGSDNFISTGTIDVQQGANFTVSTSSGTAALGRIINAGTVLLSQATASVGSISGGTLTVNETNIFNLDAMNVISFSSGGTTSLVSGAGKDAVRAKIFGTYAMDMTDRGLIVDYDGASPLAGLTTKLKNASNNGWAAIGNAIYSTNAAADNTHRGVGIAELSTLFGTNVPTTFLGQNVDATTVAARYTYLGDTNLDGQVDIVDLGVLAGNYQQAGSWSTGDLNYDGKINIVDLGLLAGNWRAGTTGAGVSFAEALAMVNLSGTSVPEPGLALLSLLGFGLRRSRATR